jgi:hypothetical protein
LIYSQIWLKIVREDRHFFFFFLWMYDVSKVVLAVQSYATIQAPFQGMLAVASGLYEPGKHRTSNTPIRLCGETTHPSTLPEDVLTPGAHVGKLLQYCALCGMNDIAHKSMRFLSALLLHNMYMPQNCSSAIINSRTLQSVVCDLR